MILLEILSWGIDGSYNICLGINYVNLVILTPWSVLVYRQRQPNLIVNHSRQIEINMRSQYSVR